MDKYRVGIDHSFFQPDGTPIIPELDLAPFTGPDIEHFRVPANPDIAAADLEDADALILLLSRFTRASAPASGRLSVAARFGVGYDTVDVAACSDNAIALTIAPSGVRRPMGVTFLTLIMALTGNLLIKDRLTRMGPEGWARKDDYKGYGLTGRTLGALGLGNVGSEMFRLAKPLDMDFIACDPYVEAAHARSLGVRLVDRPTLFREADIVCVACLLNEETHHIVNADMLALMKPTAYLVNAARGPIVDQAALTRVLQERRIAGAALDVFEKEPPDADDPLLRLDNVLLTPHALCWTDELAAGLAQADTKAVLDVMQGRVPETIVNREILDNPTWRAKLDGYRDRFGG